ncbi:MAG: AraC family transcriptional regulator [Bacillota bacterium]|nr:MAG: hypothetical protein DIU70_09320 [Bacillota bacterium]
MNFPPEKIREWVENEVVTGLLEGVLSPREAWQYGQFLGWNGPPDTALVVGIDHFARMVEHKSERFKQELRRKVLAAVRGALAELAGGGCPGPIGTRGFGTEEGPAARSGLAAGACLAAGDTVAVVLRSQADPPLPGSPESAPEPEERATAAAEAIRHRVQTEVGCTVTVGVSRLHPDPRELPVAFAEALEAHNAKFFLGRDRVIRAAELPPVQAQAPFTLPASLVNAIRSGHPEAVREAVGEVFAGVTSPAESRYRALAAGFAAFQAALAAGMDEVSLARVGAGFLAQVSRFELLGDLQELVVETILSLTARDAADPVAAAMAYVRHHYHSPCRLEEVARAVHLSPFHFSRLFKKRTGMTFGQYLTAERVERARQLLLHSNLPIDEVARRVGYHKTGHFSRKFREQTGMTPSEYRRRAREKEA